MSRKKWEVDLVCETPRGLHLFEIKSTRTLSSHAFQQLVQAKALLGERVVSQRLLAPIEETFEHAGILVEPWSAELQIH